MQPIKPGHKDSCLGMLHHIWLAGSDLCVRDHIVKDEDVQCMLRSCDFVLHMCRSDTQLFPHWRLCCFCGIHHTSRFCPQWGFMLSWKGFRVGAHQYIYCETGTQFYMCFTCGKRFFCNCRQPHGTFSFISQSFLKDEAYSRLDRCHF